MNPRLTREGRGLGLALLLGSAALATPLAAQRPDPLGGFVAEALRANLGLTAERLAEQRAAAEVRVARGLFLPSLALESRYSRLEGVPNVKALSAKLNQ